MASLTTVLTALRNQVAAATTGLISHSPDTMGVPINVEVGLYWPSAKTLQNNVRKIDNSTGNLTALITIYDRGLASNVTSWFGNVISRTFTPATMTITLNGDVIEGLSPDPRLALGDSATLVFNGPITVGDAAAIILARSPNEKYAVVVIAGATDTPTTMAAQLVTLLSDDLNLAAWVSASAVGATVTITNILAPDSLLSLVVNIGNGGTETIEIGRRSRHFQIVLWTRTPDDRDTVADQIEAMIATLEYNYGMTFSDGSLGRVLFTGDVLRDDATLSDTMRRDFMICVEYPITTTDLTYQVLAASSHVDQF